MKCSFGEIADVLHSNHSFVILSHFRPDGDALGSQLAMALSLKELGKQVTVWNQDGLVGKLKFLPGGELVTPLPDAPQDFDVVLILDTGSKERVGSPLQFLGKYKVLVNIDHHISNEGYGDLVHIDSSSPATGQIIYELLKSQNLPITYAVADNLFVAISTDTGSFQYSNTTARTFEIAAELTKAGVNVGEVSRLTYHSHPKRHLLLQRELLNEMRFECNDRVAAFALTLETREKIGAIPDDTEGLIDVLRAIEGVIVAVFFEELEGGKVRVSMRSKEAAINVCELCKLFGGGGHALAAGARIPGDLKSVEDKVLEAICNEISNFA